MTNPSVKQDLRVQALWHRERLEASPESHESVARLFWENIKPQKNQIIGGYWPKGREFDMRYILDDALKGGYTCALPAIEGENLILKYVRWDAKTKMHKGRFGIMEPVLDSPELVEPDIVLVPLLAFDRRGYRLGTGGGYFDSTLADLRKKKNIEAVGVAYAEQAVLFNLPVEPHDQKLDWVITPGQALCFKDG